MNSGSISARPMRYPSLADTDLASILQLIRSENVGPITFFNLLEYYGSVEKALRALPDLAKKGGSRAPKLCARAKAEEELLALHDHDITVIPYGADAYPEALLAVDDAPPLLMLNGSSDVWQKPCIGIVGARNASGNGCQFARKIAHDLGEQGYTIVSGLARGVDGYAHSGALESGTVGVIAGGINTVYPPEHASLYQQLFAQGAVITEVPFNTSPQARHFPARNRIIAGMCKAVVVIEAARRSGTLITARMALEYGRDVLAVPGSPLDPRCEGTNDLIKQGAGVITSADDVIEALATPRPFAMSEPLAPEYRHYEYEETAATPALDTESAQSLILEKLSPSPIHLDELAAQCHIMPHQMQVALLQLELSGAIERHAGGRISKIMEHSAA